MEFIACLVGGIAFIGCSFGLSRLRPPNWQADGDLVEVERAAIQWWARVQVGIRRINNSLICLVGVLIISAGCVPHGQAWVILWSAILVLLMICIMLAMVDAISSFAGYKRALPEAARRSFGSADLAAIATKEVTETGDNAG